MEAQTNLIQPILTQNDHDTIIEIRTTLNGLVTDVKQYNANNTALEARVRTLENLSNTTLGGWKTITLILGAVAGLSGLILGSFNYFLPHIK